MISKIKILASTIIFFGTAAASTASAQDYAPRWGEWDRWGDCGDGTYRNPVIPSDYSDLDCIRVGKEYYAITSTFQFSPGITILRSEDLVNWTICGHAVPDITQIGPELNWDRMNRYGKGIWAGTLRYHGGRFYIFFGTPDEGFFMTSARKPEGPWEPLTHLMETGGWDDCTVMWDSDGRAYFVGRQNDRHGIRTPHKRGQRTRSQQTAQGGRLVLSDIQRTPVGQGPLRNGQAGKEHNRPL